MRSSTEGYDFEATVSYTDQGGQGTQPVEHREEKGGMDDGFQVVKSYLQIEEGREFSMTFIPTRPVQRTHGLRVVVHVDGRDLGVPVFLPDRMHYIKKTMDVKQGSATMQACLKLASMDTRDVADDQPKTSEEAEVAIRGDAVNSLGKITATVEEGTWTPSGAIGKTNQPVEELGPVHEKQPKAGTVAPIKNRDHYIFKSTKKSKLCKFVFSYSTRALLVIKGIIDEEEQPAQDVRGAAQRPIDGATAPAVDSPPAQSVKEEPKPDIKPDITIANVSTRRRRTRTSLELTLPLHGSTDRPFKIDNEDSADEVTVDHNSIHKKRRITLDYTDLD